MWNMLVSVSFQFVGFLLTYLLHTTHAARLGSRAGLGVTLIQYGFALRGRLDNANGPETDGTTWSGWVGEPVRPTESTSYHSRHYGTPANLTVHVVNDLNDQQVGMKITEATTEWLAFFLMTVGMCVVHLGKGHGSTCSNKQAGSSC